VKKPAESKGPWDYYKLRATIPADQAFRPMDQATARCVKMLSRRNKSGPISSAG
jgi:branched-chain amino acid transport system substrate-binding protein